MLDEQHQGREGGAHVSLPTVSSTVHREEEGYRQCARDAEESPS